MSVSSTRRAARRPQASGQFHGPPHGGARQDPVGTRHLEPASRRDDARIFRGAFREGALFIERKGEIHARVHGLHFHQDVGKIIHALEVRERRLPRRDRAADRPGAAGMEGHERTRIRVRDHVKSRLRAFGGTDAEPARPAGDQDSHQSFAPPARPDRLDDVPREFLVRPGQGQANALRRRPQARQVGLQVVQGPGDVLQRFKNAVPPVGQVVVRGDHHQGRIRDDSLRGAGIHRKVVLLPGVAMPVQGGEELLRPELGSRLHGHRSSRRSAGKQMKNGFVRAGAMWHTGRAHAIPATTEEAGAVGRRGSGMDRDSVSGRRRGAALPSRRFRGGVPRDRFPGALPRGPRGRRGLDPVLPCACSGASMTRTSRKSCRPGPGCSTGPWAGVFAPRRDR